MDDEVTKAREEEADDEQISRFCDAFTTDFDGTSALIISAIEKETEPPTVIVETLTEILRQVDTCLPGETCERFESELIPHVVQVVLAKSDDAVMDSEGVECIADFLEIVLERVAHRLLYCDPCLLPTLMRILDEHRSFYENRLDGVTEEKTPFVNEDSTRVSSLYLRIISHWGTIGGFTLLLRCLQASGARSETEDDQQQTPEGGDVPEDVPKETVFAFEAIQYIYRSIYAIKDHLSLEFLKQFVAPLAQSSRIYVTSMTDSEFSAVPRERLLEIVHIVEIVVAQASTNDSDEEDELASTVAEAELCVHLLHLDLLLRFFTSSSLEKRIYGLVEMIDVFNKATSVHSDYYAKWIGDNQLVDLLFGEKKHPELIKRALPVIHFVLASHDASSDWIDAMWVCLGGRKLQAPATDRDPVSSQGADSQTHEVVRVAVNGLLVEVVGIADIEVLEHLLNLIQDSSRPLDVDMITLVSSMAKRASSLRKPALMYMWSRLQHASKSAADQAIEEIVVVLGRSLDDMEVEEENLVDVFIGLCGDSIESGTSSLSASLRLVEKIGSLVREHHIVVNKAIASRLVPALLVQMNVFEQQFKQISDDVDYSASDAEDHVHGVRERLLALRGCMVIALISMCEVSTMEVVDSVWDLCVRTANQIDETASLFFQWIEYCFRTKIVAKGSEVGERLLNEPLAEQLMERRFGVLDGAAMTMSALGCFHHLFRKVNISHGGIVVYNSDGAQIDEEDEPEEAESQTLSDLLTGKPIVGVEQLWRFALHASDQSVAEEAMTLLARYHMDVAPSLVGSEFADGRKRDFVAKCIGHLRHTESQNHVTPPTAASERKDAVSVIGRCLDCLRYFLEANQGNKGSDSGCIQAGDRDRYSALASADGESLNKYALDNLEQKLQLLDVFPSPMKESPFGSDATSEAGTPTMMYTGPRRPSWNFRQHHSLLEAIQDENDSEVRPTEDDNIDEKQEADHSVIVSGNMRRGELIIDVPSAERRLSIDTSVPGTLRPTQLTTSPAVRARPNLQWFQTDQASTSQEPGFVIQDLDAGISDIELSDSTTQSPLVVAQLLVNWPRLFDTLFDLVDSDDEATSQRAWGLLCQLPINAEVLKHMLKLRAASNEDVLWTNILDAGTPYRLLYCLRLIEALLVSSRPKEPVKTSEDKVRRQWRERFLRLGGAQHLVDLLSYLRAWSDKTAISLSCIAAISRTLAYFARLHYSPPDLIDVKSPFDSRLTNSTLSQAFPLSGHRFESLLNVVIEMMHQSTAPYEDGNESTLLCVFELFCGLVPLNAAQALATLNRDTKNGVRDLLKVIFSSFKSVDSQRKAINLIVEMKDQFVSQTAGHEFHEAVLKGALEMNCAGEQSQALLELIISISSHLPAIADWVLEHAIVDKVLSKIESFISGQSTELQRSAAALGSYLRVAAAISSKPGFLQESCLKFRAPGFETNDLPWILDLAARRILWNTDSSCESSIDEPTTRQAAQDMISALVFSSGLPSSPYAMCVLRQLTSYYNTIQSRFETMGRPWNIRPMDEIQDPSPGGIHFAGLVNPGCVCYMNSLMQQLFMTPAFRNGLLSIDASSSTTEWQNEIAELQKLFVALSVSQRRALDPTEFAVSHRDMDGNPTDLNVQMDADEFFCLLLDRVETCVLKSSSPRSTADGQATFLDQCFGGVLVNQILTEHGHLSEREEKFFALSLDISQKQRLPESLSLYVEGETLDGDNAYYCEQVKKKVSATKRVCIKKLPQTLVCHLKRFEFDFDTMEKIKIHDYLAFPEEIDMFPYTSEAFSATRGDNCSSIMYDLVGIVVHSGSSDMGHYYSFIKDRTAAPGDPSSWYEFNDQTVKPFDVSTMGDECFGGEEVSQKWDQASRTYTPMVHRKRRSAYMLVYERRGGDEYRSGIKASAIVDWDAAPASVQKLRGVVLQENQELRHIVNSTTPDHINFLNQLVISCFERNDENHPEDDDISEEDPQTRDVHVFDDITEAVLRTEDADLHAAIIACKHVFGVSSLLSTDDETAIGTLLESVEGWIRTETAAGEGRKVLFCRWLLTQAVSRSATRRSDRGFIRRSWLFDVLVFCEKRLPFMQSCCSLLRSSLQFLSTHARTDRDQQAAIEFLRYIGKLFYDRHDVVIEDPASGSRFPVPHASVIHSSTILGAFLKDCVSTEHGDSIKTLFLAKSGFVDRFLFSFQENGSPRNAGSSLMAPLTSRVRSCTFSLERQLFSDASTSLAEMREDILEDPRLLMCHSVLKNIVSFEFTEVLTPLIVYCVEHQMSRAQGDKLVSLLLAVLEEVKSTHLEQLLHIFGALLDAEQQGGSSGGLASVHEHIFSPSSGLIEAAAYYRDHRTLHEYAFLLVEFVITRAEASPRLQRYFQNDEEIAGQVEWVKHWLGSYLDPSGTIRRTIDDVGEEGNATDSVQSPRAGTKDQQDDPTLDKEVHLIFKKAERAFGFAMLTTPASAETEETRLDNNKAFAVESLEDSDGLLFSSDGENQDDDDDDNTPGDPTTGKALASKRTFHTERRLSLKSSRVASTNERRRPEVEEQASSSSSTIVTRAHMSSAA